MSVFMLVPTEDAEKLKHIVAKSFSDEKDRFILDGHACFVSFSGTSSELANLLDLPGAKKRKIVPVPQ